MSYYTLYMDSSGNGKGVGASTIETNFKGIFYTSNFGREWTQSTSNVLGPFNSVYLSGSYALAASNANGLYYSSDSGQTWTQSNITKGGFNSVFLNGQLALATSNSGVVYSSNYGVTWKTATAVAQNYFGVCIIVAPSGSSYSYYAFAAGMLGLYYNFTNNLDEVGASWTLVQGTSQGFVSVAASNDPLQPGYVIATSSTSGIWSSNDFGVSWTNVQTAQVTTLAFSGQFAMAGSYQYSGLYFSTDYGVNWNKSPDVWANTEGIAFFTISLVGQTAVLSYTTGLSPTPPPTPGEGIFYTTNLGYSLNFQPITDGPIYALTALVQKDDSFYSVITDGYTIWNSKTPVANPTFSTWNVSSVVYPATSSAQGTMTVTSSVSTSSKSTTNNNLVTNTYTATATGSGTGETYDKALEAAAKASLESLVKVLYETARQESPGPIVSTALVTATKAPRNNN